MSILNITNLTNTPEKDIKENYFNAFAEYEKEKNIKIDESKKLNFIDNQIEELEERMKEAQGKDLLGIIDNYLVNLDYLAEVKEYFHQKV